MLTSLKVSSLTCKCVFFYRLKLNSEEDPMKLNFEGLEMQKWSIPTDRAQRVNEISGVIYLVIMFTCSIVVITMPKKAHFLYYLLITAKH